jgi:hypothetical protein
MSDYESNIPSPVIISNNLPKNENVSISTSDKTKTDVPFWSENPNVLLNTSYIFEFFPAGNMSYAQKLNAITRLVLLMTIVGFILTKSIRIVIISAITLFSIHLIYGHYKKNKAPKNDLEGFENPNLAIDTLNEQNIEISPDVFDSPSVENPFSNVLMNDYDYNPNKKPAPPIAKPEVNNTILSQAKEMVQKLNPGQPNISDKLFRDLGEQYVFEQSLRPFYSTASTTIPNDQAGFADFCYGSMISCKEGNMFACARNNALKHTNQ